MMKFPPNKPTPVSSSSILQGRKPHNQNSQHNCTRPVAVEPTHASKASLNDTGYSQALTCFGGIRSLPAREKSIALGKPQLPHFSSSLQNNGIKENLSSVAALFFLKRMRREETCGAMSHFLGPILLRTSKRLLCRAAKQGTTKQKVVAS